jgi:hypothetical protein
MLVFSALPSVTANAVAEQDEFETHATEAARQLP